MRPGPGSPASIDGEPGLQQEVRRRDELRVGVDVAVRRHDPSPELISAAVRWKFE